LVPWQWIGEHGQTKIYRAKCRGAGDDRAGGSEVAKQLESRYGAQASVNPSAGEREMARMAVTGFAEHVLAGKSPTSRKLLAR
jgi:hypothetical protein